MVNPGSCCGAGTAEVITGYGRVNQGPCLLMLYTCMHTHTFATRSRSGADLGTITANRASKENTYKNKTITEYEATRCNPSSLWFRFWLISRIEALTRTNWTVNILHPVVHFYRLLWKPSLNINDTTVVMQDANLAVIQVMGWSETHQICLWIVEARKAEYQTIALEYHSISSDQNITQRI